MAIAASAKHPRIHVDVAAGTVRDGVKQNAWIGLTYDARCPWAVDAALTAADNTVVHTALPRPELARGLRRGTHSSPLRLWVTPIGRVPAQLLHLCWRNGSSTQEWTVPIRAVYEFLLDTYALVPRGAERSAIDLDRELRDLLAHPD